MHTVFIANSSQPERKAIGLSRYVSDALVDVLARLGCRYLPLNPGSSFRGLHDSLVNHGDGKSPGLILCTHEEIAVSASHAYAKATGTVGFSAVHDLVGLMHASMAVYDAWCDRTPLVVLGGGGPAEPAERRPIDWFHSANTQSELVRPYVKWDNDPTSAQGTIDAVLRAHRIAGSAPTGPTYVTIDAAVQEAEDLGVDTDVSNAPHTAPFVARADEIEMALDALWHASFPVVVAGGVGLDPMSTPLLVELMERLGAAGRDERNLSSIPTAHPLSFNGDDTVLADADVILAVDAHDIRWIRARTSKDPRIIDLSTRSLATRPWLNADHIGSEKITTVVSDPVEGLRALLAHAAARLDSSDDTTRRRSERLSQLQRRRQQLDESRSKHLEDHWDDRPISIARMLSEVYRAITHLHWLLVLRNTRSWQEGIWQFERAGRFLGHSGGGGMGYGPGALIGGGLAARDRGEFAVGIIGDGDLMYGPGAIWTAVNHSIPILVVVNNNQTYLNDEQHQAEIARARGRPVDMASVGTALRQPDIDFASLARSLGAWAEGPIEDPDVLSESLRRAVRTVEDGGVALVDVHTSK